MQYESRQEMVCTFNGPWENRMGVVFPGPKKNEIVTFAGISIDDSACVYLVEYNYIAVDARVSFYHKHFQPVADISELTEILKSQPAEV